MTQDRVVWSAGSYQWSAISSASPFTTETWCLIFDMSFWKFEATIKEWNFWRPRSSWRLWSRVEEGESSQTHRPPPSATRWLPRGVVWLPPLLPQGCCYIVNYGQAGVGSYSGRWRSTSPFSGLLLHCKLRPGLPENSSLQRSEMMLLPLRDND